MMIVSRKNNSYDLFNNFFNDDLFIGKQLNFMKTDVKEKDNKYLIQVDLPGCSKDNINLSLISGYLKIVAKVFEEDNDKEEKYLCHERFYGECSRSFYVGDAVSEEDINAEFRNGVLKIEVLKFNNVDKQNVSKNIDIK